jgi:gas vesicle protein
VFWYGVGAGIAIGAAAVAWLCDSATKEEEERQERLREKIKDLEAELNKFDVKLEGSNQKALKNSILEVIKRLDEGCSEFEKNKNSIHQELDELSKYINRELTNDEIGPFRRQALMKNRCLVEEAEARLKAYLGYLEYYRNKLLSEWKSQAQNTSSVDGFAKILKGLAPPSPTLPDDYLYIGKVVLLQDHELDVELPYDSKIHLNGRQGTPNNISQKQIFELYKDEEGYSAIQILSESAGKRGNHIFYGCAARGNAWLMRDDGIEFHVHHKSTARKFYQLEAFEGLLQAELPEHLVDNPFIGLIDGQRITAWFNEYELLLGWRSSKDERKPRPKVTMIPGETSNSDPEPVYLLMNNSLSEGYGSQLGVECASNWMLLDASIRVKNKKYQGNLVLLNGNVKVVCDIDHDNGCLTAISVESCFPSGNEFDLGIRVIPLAAHLWSDALKGQEGINTICGLAQQIKVNEGAGDARAESAQRFERWRQVVEYQKSQNLFTLEFSGRDLELLDSGNFALPNIKVVTDSDLKTSAEWIKKYRETQKNLKFRRAPFCKLEMFYSGNSHSDGQWRNIANALGRSERRLTVTIESGDILIGVNSEISCRDAGMMIRLTLEVFDASLKRQQEALEDYKNDRLAAPMLKEILSSPGSYNPTPDSSWVEYFSSGTNWQNKTLTRTQQDVIRSALTDRNISIIQGPPGTAKTTSIVEMLFQIYKHNPETRVLLVSQQHAAVDNALKRFLEIQSGPLGGESGILRIGPEKKMDDAVRPYALGTILDEFKENSMKNINGIVAHGNPLARDLAYQWQSLMSVDDDLDSELVSLFINSRKLVGATCVGLAGKISNIDKMTFDIVIIDEAGRSTVPELLIPINRARKLILIGDHFQLPPSVAPMLREDDAKETLPFIEEEFLETSFFEILYKQLPEQCKTRLEEQFRMPVPIGDLVANLFYTVDGERRLFNGREKPENDFLYKGKEIVQWVDVNGRQSKDSNSESLLNELEADYVLRFLKIADNKSKCSKTVAVITPYGAQKRLLNSVLKGSECFTTNESDSREFLGKFLKIRVDTVDSFQGSEAELVLYSVVRTKGNLRFILDWKRLNVACSRAKENLVFFGNKKFLKNWQSLSGERNLFKEILEQIE